jgi:hypothetical protein
VIPLLDRPRKAGLHFSMLAPALMPMPLYQASGSPRVIPVEGPASVGRLKLT